ncbi:MAG: hypothetical protein LBS45_11180, partial [Synergistaceae bacterium]|nr:hypothetical protein [Synergistaceae bacterium]
LYSQKKYQEAYDIFTTLADRYYGCNYLSAYWAGAAAEKLKHADNARRWYKRALEVNPDYKPAQDALAKLSGEPKSGSGAGSKDGTIWDKYL